MGVIHLHLQTGVSMKFLLRFDELLPRYQQGAVFSYLGQALMQAWVHNCSVCHAYNPLPLRYMLGIASFLPCSCLLSTLLQGTSDK